MTAIRHMLGVRPFGTTEQDQCHSTLVLTCSSWWVVVCAGCSTCAFRGAVTPGGLLVCGGVCFRLRLRALLTTQGGTP